MTQAKASMTPKAVLGGRSISIVNPLRPPHQWGVKRSTAVVVGGGRRKDDVGDNIVEKNEDVD